MEVGIDEAGQQHPTLEIDLDGVSSQGCAALVFLADRQDPAVAHRHRPGGRLILLERVDLTTEVELSFTSQCLLDLQHDRGARGVLRKRVLVELHSEARLRGHRDRAPLVVQGLHDQVVLHHHVAEELDGVSQ